MSAIMEIHQYSALRYVVVSSAFRHADGYVLFFELVRHDLMTDRTTLEDDVKSSIYDFVTLPSPEQAPPGFILASKLLISCTM